MKRMRTGFTMALTMMMFMGLTVHYWAYMWTFWGLCIGIRASLREQSIVAAQSLTCASGKNAAALSTRPRQASDMIGRTRR